MSVENFFTLTPDRILDAVERHCGRGTGRVFQLNSLENRVYEVEIEEQGGRPVFSVIAKFYRPGRWSEEQILEEHRFLQELSAEEVPVIPPLSFSGETLFRDDRTDILYSIFPKVRGRMLDEVLDEHGLRLGSLMARLHNIGSRRASPSRLALTPRSFVEEDVNFILSSDLMSRDLAERYVTVIREILAKCSPYFEGIPMHRIHGDCHLGNVMWGRVPIEGGWSEEGLFLVDFDDMLNGPAVQDLWLLFPGRDEFTLRQREQFLASYETLRIFPLESLVLIEPLRTFRMIRYAAWIARRWSDPSFPRTFPGFGTRGYWEEQIRDLFDQLEFIPG